MKKCILCGDEFTPKNGTSCVCYKDHTCFCTSCGKKLSINSYKKIPKFKDKSIIPFHIIHNSKQEFLFTHVKFLCSDCRKQKRVREKELSLKSKNNLNKCVCDEVESFLNSDHKKMCYKKKHYFICSYCNKKVLFRSIYDIPIDLPYKIIVDNEDEFVITYIDHYCKDCKKNNPYVKRKHDDMIYDRICSNNLEKYGDYCYQSKEVKNKSVEKCKKTMMGKHGVKYAFHLDYAKEKAKNSIHTEEAEEKREKTCLEKYGVDNYAKTEEFREFVSEYTKINMLNPDTQKKRKLSTLLSIGYEEVYYSPGHAEKMLKAAVTPEAKEKYRKTMLERYGVINSYFLPGHADKMIEAAAKSENNLHKYSKVNKDFKKLLDVNGINNEQEFYINRKSFDFHILNTNILIEINPTVTHNSTISFLKLRNIDNDADPMSKTHHIERLKFVEDNGYILLNIWDWTGKELFISLLKNYLNKSIVEIDNFLNDGFIDFNYYQLFKGNIDINVELINYCYIDGNKEVYVPRYKLI